MNKKPNIILIVIDAARADHFSCYGYHRKTTPFMDKIANEGILYNNAISTAGWTLPSHASMFTGTYPSKHGAHNENFFLSDKLPTMTEALTEQGYKTVGFCRGDWVSDSTGLTRGFEEYYNLHFSKFQHKMKRLINYFKINGVDTWSYEINKNVKKWIKENSSPFFMFIHYSELHLPYSLPNAYRKKFVSVSDEELNKVNQNPKEYYSGRVKMTEKDFQISRDLYDGALAYQDRRIGELYQFLKIRGVLDNTVFIITSDHGESLGDKEHFDHYYVLYEPIIRIPLIVRHPGIFGTGVRDDSLVQTLDFFPTVLEMLNIDRSAYNEMQGIPLPPLNNGEKREFTISERFQDLKGLKESYPDMDLSHLEKFEKDRKVAIRTKEFKLIKSMRGNSELYKISEDPHESTNLIDEREDVVSELNQKLDEWKKSFDPAEISGDEPEFDDEMVKRLKSLGYLG
ncbi:sulfatase-like hydrolase/transferase [candidate division KSB1 bacterium]|nr:sulfatase-like hydrolase/transferase [candidate division KSB1 bacterium]